jgi:hypothetical protein
MCVYKNMYTGAFVKSERTTSTPASKKMATCTYVYAHIRTCIYTHLDVGLAEGGQHIVYMYASMHVSICTQKVVKNQHIHICIWCTSMLASPKVASAVSSEKPMLPYSSGVNTVVGTWLRFTTALPRA